MAVYTEVSPLQIEGLLKNRYGITAPFEAVGIPEGIENTNYLLKFPNQKLILTIFEKRVAKNDLPFFLNLMEYLHENGIPSAKPVADIDGEYINTLCDKPSVLVHFLEGTATESPTENQCQAVGACLAKIHNVTQGFKMSRANSVGVSQYHKMFTPSKTLSDAIARVQSEWLALSTQSPQLPKGIIHGDLFPDNVLFETKATIGGVIDFYFACEDFLAYDLAITINAWCFEESPFQFFESRANALLRGYENIRPLTTAEKTALPFLLKAASIRFWLTRLIDKKLQRGEKEPLTYERIYQFKDDLKWLRETS